MPLLYEDEVIGVLELLDREEAPSYNAADMEALGQFANQAAVAIEQSRAQGNLAALLSGVLGSLGEVTAHQREALREEASSFVEGIEEDAVHQRALELASLVREISQGGEEEFAACRTILQGFAEYLQSKPRPEDQAGELW